MSCQDCSLSAASTEVKADVVGVRFGEEANLTPCLTGGRHYSAGDRVIVRLDRGLAHGRVEKAPMPVYRPCQRSSARKLLRQATAQDIANFERKREREQEAKRFAREKVEELGLKMKVSQVDFALNGRLAVFYFTAESRVDFRQLVRELSSRFSTRIKMVQLGSRDEARLVAGVGVCGRTLCCSTFLESFRPISIQMAKRQNLSLNPSKISGQCGRLLCCLAYEYDDYRARSTKKPRAEREGGAQER